MSVNQERSRKSRNPSPVCVFVARRYGVCSSNVARVHLSRIRISDTERLVADHRCTTPQWLVYQINHWKYQTGTWNKSIGIRDRCSFSRLQRMPMNFAMSFVCVKPFEMFAWSIVVFDSRNFSGILFEKKIHLSILVNSAHVSLIRYRSVISNISICRIMLWKTKVTRSINTGEGIQNVNFVSQVSWLWYLRCNSVNYPWSPSTFNPVRWHTKVYSHLIQH